MAAKMNRMEFAIRMESLLEPLVQLHRDFCGEDVKITLVARSPSNPAACGISAVGWFEGISGAYSIEDDRVRAVSEEVP